MEPAPAGREGRRIEHRREGERQYDQRDVKKKLSQTALKQQWVIAPEANPAFIAAMEDVLEVYQRPRDPERPWFV